MAKKFNYYAGSGILPGAGNQIAALILFQNRAEICAERKNLQVFNIIGRFYILNKEIINKLK